MSLLSAELAATCNALGYYDKTTEKYYADENTLETAKDLIRYLRKDDENHDIRRQLGETKVLETDLLPLLKTYWEEVELFDVLLRLLVNLTTHPLILWNEEIPTDRNARNYFMQIEDHLQNYKLAFVDQSVWVVLSSRLSKILESDYLERTDDEGLIIERILVLIRNILYVPINPSVERRPDTDANTHDQVLWAMHHSGILDLLLYISGSSNEHAYHTHVLEILSQLLREQNPTDLGKTELERNQEEKLKNEKELLTVRQRESIKKRQKTKEFSGARHSRFGGTFTVKSMKSISDNNLIYHKPLRKLDSLSFDVDKQKPKTSKNRQPFRAECNERRSAFSVRLFLKEFCVEFLTGAYNTLMSNVKDKLVRAKSQNNDTSYYLWAVRFFMGFNRAYKFDVKLVSETMSVQTFHYIQQQMENYYDLIQTDRKKFKAWSRRLHIALTAYRELLLTLCAMDKSPDGTVRDSGKVIKSNIFYVLEYRELVLTFLVTYDPLKMSDKYLQDLIETQHIFLKLFEAFCRDGGSVMVQKKSRGRRKRRRDGGVPAAAQEVSELNLERDWDEASQQISVVLEGNITIPDDVVPFDATSDVPIDEQKSEAMMGIQRKLRAGEYEHAIALLRAAREIWPENNSFGSPDMSPEEEFTSIRDIFMADLGENQPRIVEQPIYDANDEEEEEDEEEEGTCFEEGDLKFEDFVKRLCHPKVIAAAAAALSKFEENSSNSNHCIVKLLHRIAFDCKMFAMMFQVSLFITFRKIYALKDVSEYKELTKFATFVLRQFFKVAETNKKIYMEALFWKSPKEAYDVENGYGSYQERSAAAAQLWSEQQEDEVRLLFMEHKEKQLEEDVVDWIVENLIDNTRTRRGVLKKLKDMYLLTDYKPPKKGRITSRVPIEWGTEEEEQLKELYDEFKDAMDPLGCIMDRLNVSRPKNRIIEKLLVLGLIQDRKQLRKKRAKGNSSRARDKSRFSDPGSDEESDASGDDDDDGGNPRFGRPTTSNPSRRKDKKTGGTMSLVNISSKRLAEMTLTILRTDMKEALEWLKDSYSDALEDIEDDSDEGIPLVPIMDYSVNAMENNDFQALLLEMGVVKPADGQEAYWRIPSTINVDVIKYYIQLLTDALEDNLIVPVDENSQTTISAHHESSDDEDIFAKLREQSKNREENEPTTSYHNESNNESSDEDIFQKLKSTEENKIRKRRRISSSNDSEPINGNPLDIAEEQLKKKIKKKKTSNKKTKTNVKKNETSKKEKMPKKRNTKTETYVSREFLPTDDSSSDDGESERRVQQYYDQKLQENANIDIEKHQSDLDNSRSDSENTKKEAKQIIADSDDE